MADCTCNNFPAGLGNVTFGANVGIGTTPAEWDSAFRGLQIGGTGTISAHSAAAAAGHAFNIMQNAYYGLGGSPPSVDFHYLAADAASRVMLGGGAFQVFTAPAGGVGAVIPWTERVRVANDGNVGINTPNPSEKLEVNGNAKVAGKVTVGKGTDLGVVFGDSGCVIYAHPTGSRLDISAGTVVLFGTDDGPAGGVDVRIGGQGVFKVRDRTTAADRAVIDNKGNLSLGRPGALPTDPDKGGAIKQIYGRVNVGISANTYDDLIFNYGGQPGQGAVLWMWGTQGGGDQGGGTQKMKLDVDGSLHINENLALRSDGAANSCYYA